jgi:hypothetical protein
MSVAREVTEVPDLTNGATKSTEGPEKMNLFSLEKLVFSGSSVSFVAPFVRSGTSEISVRSDVNKDSYSCARSY